MDIQGVPLPFFTFQVLITVKIYFLDLMLVKLNCVWESNIYFENCTQSAENQNKCTLLKHILAFPTWGQMCIITEL